MITAPYAGQWAVKSGTAGNPYIAQGVSLGSAGCAGLVGDFNGDRVSDFVVDCGGQWAVKSGTAGNPYIAQGVGLGSSTDMPITGPTQAQVYDHR